MTGDAVRLRAGEASADFALSGGELISWRIGGKELVWHGDPAHWNRSAPILFPVVGASAGGHVRVDGTSYPMPQHGFARDSAFALVERREDSLRLRLQDSAATRHHYPFAFRLDVTASLTADTLRIGFEVGNPGTRPLPYAIGFHPAFPWPLDGEDRGGHSVTFDLPENPEVPDVAPGGLLKQEGRRLELAGGRRLDLDPALFTEALVFLDAQSRSLRFAAPSGAALTMMVSDFPHLALWTKPTAPFLSLEAWTGHADLVGFAGDLRDRASIRQLEAGGRALHEVVLAWQPG